MMWWHRFSSWSSWGLLYGFCALMLAFLAAPVVIVLLVSLSSADFVYFPPPGYSLRWYAHLFEVEGFIASFWLSVRLALLVSAPPWRSYAISFAAGNSSIRF